MEPFDFKLNITLDNWQDHTFYAIRGPKLDKRDHTILVAIDRTILHDTIEDFAKEKLDTILENLQNAEIQKKQEITLPGGNPAYEVIFERALHDMYVVYKRYIFVFAHDMGFTINCDFSIKTLDLLRGQMNQIIEGLLPGTFEANPEQEKEPAPVVVPPAPSKPSDHLW